MLDLHFELFNDRLKLTTKQRDEVKTRVSGVSKSLYEEFYGGEYNSKTRLIIGSHGKKTETRHPVGDIDLIFKISKEDLDRYQAYDSNGPSALLSRARAKLEQTYPVSDKRSWGKVVLVKFTTGHDVEVLPCYENSDGTFTIPNSENGGTWDSFDPRAEMRLVKESNDKTGITRELIKFAKRWNNKCGKTIKSFQIEFFCVSYLDAEFDPNSSWSQTVESFFVWLELQDSDLSGSAISRVGTAKARAQKARDYELAEDYKNACIEWRKIFGQVFPVYDPELDTIKAHEQKYPSVNEEYIHDKYPVRIDRNILLSIIPKVKRNGWRDFMLFGDYFRQGVEKLPKTASLVFKAQCSLGGTAEYRWKIRNLSDDARIANDLRGEIIKGQGKQTREEGTRYLGTHYIECYAIRDGVCVAIQRLFVPIGEVE